MKRRLILSYLGLTVLVLLILEVPLAVVAARFERQNATSMAARDASSLVALASDQLAGSDSSQLRSTVTEWQSRTAGEVAVVSPTGALLAASSHDADDDIKQEWRPELARAQAGQETSAYTNDEGKPYAVASAPVVEDGRLAAAVVLAAPAAMTQSRIHQIWLMLGVFALGAIAVASVAGVVAARSLALPLGRLADSVDRLGAGNLTARADECYGPAEIRSLARQFNDMAARVDKMVEDQKRFVADASHQLRSPLTALRLRLENVEATGGADASTVIAAGREVQRLSRIVDGLLALTRSGQDTTSPIDVSLPAVIAERCEAWSALAAERGVAVECRPPASPVSPSRLRSGDVEQILDNLLANSLEVSPAGTTITVELTVGPGGAATVTVADEGPGMPADDCVRAFDRFWQGPSRPTGHSGLGLAIVAQLAERNGARVALRPRHPRGLEAKVSLPASK